MDLLKRKDLIAATGFAKSTIGDWLNEFAAFIPTVKHKNITLYRPETVNILKVIKELRDQGKSKPEIMAMLAERGFPVAIEDAVKDVEQVLDQADAKAGLIEVMKTAAAAMEQLADQDSRILRLEDKIEELTRKLEEQNNLPWWKRMFK